MADPEPSDEEYIVRTASGDTRAFAVLWQRHFAAAHSVARSYRTLDADDLVAEAFAKVLRAILNGGGPEIAFRAYLFTTIRNTAATQLKQVTTVSIDRDLDPDTFSELSVDGPDVSADSVAARAFRLIPQRWQQVLWYVGVEGLSPVEAAPLLDLTPNGVSALAMRARKAFRREMVLIASAELPADSRCRPALLAKIGALGGEGPSHPLRQTDHSTDTCNQCRAILRETGAGKASISLAVLIAAIGADSLPGLVSPGAVAVAALGPPVTEVAAFSSTLPSAPATLIAAPATLAPAQFVAVTATIAAFTLAFSGSAIGGASEAPEPPAVSDVREVGSADPKPPSDEPEPTVTINPPGSTPPEPEAPAPTAPAPPPSSPAPVSRGNGAAPQFGVTSGPTTFPAQITGLATPGWTVEAFVADGPDAFAFTQIDDQRPQNSVCPRPPDSDAARIYSTGQLDRAAWSLAFPDLEPGAYTVIVVECSVIDGDRVASVFSTPQPFTVSRHQQ